MFKTTAVLLAIAIDACAVAQSFECQAVGPLPTDPSASCDGVISNGLGLTMTTGVTNVPSCGFPTNGAQYLKIIGNGPGLQVPPSYPPFLPPIGGPFPRPADPLVTEVRIPIPAGSTTVSMDWDFFNMECPTTTYYDGMSIDVVTQTGTLIQNLAYADTLTGEGTCSIGNDYCDLTSGTQGGLRDSLPNGPNPLIATLPPLTGCEYISVVVWNGNDNSYPSIVYLDNVVFNGTTVTCPVPCYPPASAPPSLQFSSPSGFGCVLVQMTHMPPGGFYFLPVTLTPGSYPNGWLFGVDISFPDLATEIGVGFPYIGPISGSACSTGSATIGEYCGLPSGLTAYTVALGFAAGSNFPSVMTAPVSYTIP